MTPEADAHLKRTAAIDTKKTTDDMPWKIHVQKIQNEAPLHRQHLFAFCGLTN